MSGIIISSLMLLILETRLPGVTSSNIYNGNNVISDFALPPSHPYCSNQSNHEDLTRLGVVPGEAEQTSRSKVEVFGEILKRHVHELRRTANRKVELVFLVDSSASVGSEEFLNELKFVKKLLADFTVDRHTTRVSVVTFSSRSRVIRHIDHLTHSRDENHKCSLLEEELPKIEYSGGGTYTLGAMLEAEVFYQRRCFVALNARSGVQRVLDAGGQPCFWMPTQVKKNSSNSSHKNSDDLFLVIIFSKFTYISVIFTNHLQKIMTTFFVISSIFLP